MRNGLFIHGILKSQPVTLSRISISVPKILQCSIDFRPSNPFVSRSQRIQISKSSVRVSRWASPQQASSSISIAFEWQNGPLNVWNTQVERLHRSAFPGTMLWSSGQPKEHQPSSISVIVALITPSSRSRSQDFPPK